jgi:hypothetical protein
MKKVLLSTVVLLAASYGFAANEPAPAPAPAAPTIVGTWDLVGLECTSGTPVSGGIKVGEDTMKGTFAADGSFTNDANIASCAMHSKGTYKLEGMKLTMTTTEGQTCKDANPMPMNETQTVYIAYLGEKDGVSVTTGKDAEKFCPAGDALISRYTREAAPAPAPQPQPQP